MFGETQVTRRRFHATHVSKAHKESSEVIPLDFVDRVSVYDFDGDRTTELIVQSEERAIVLSSREGAVRSYDLRPALPSFPPLRVIAEDGFRNDGPVRGRDSAYRIVLQAPEDPLELVGIEGFDHDGRPDVRATLGIAFTVEIFEGRRRAARLGDSGRTATTLDRHREGHESAITKTKHEEATARPTPRFPTSTLYASAESSNDEDSTLLAWLAGLCVDPAMRKVLMGPSRRGRHRRDKT